jgi:hypothetical protein
MSKFIALTVVNHVEIPRRRTSTGGASLLTFEAGGG